MGVGPSHIRNVALVGHAQAGKTTLTETLLATAGAIPRAGRVEDGTTVCDFDEAELRQQRSVSLALAPLEWAGVKVNLLDTPGYADFVGDLRAGLRAADAALFVVAATQGVDATTRALWAECAAAGTPRAIVITKLDQPRADFAATLAACQEAFGAGVAPLYLPVPGAPALAALLSRTVVDYSGGTRQERPWGPEVPAEAAGARDALIEGIIAESEDESLMDRYLAGEELDLKGLIEDLETAVARGSFYPVLAAASTGGLGSHEILEVLTSAFPSPLERPVPPTRCLDGSPCPPYTADPAGPLLAEVVKTTSDPYVGRVSLVRVFSGTLRPDALVAVCGRPGAGTGHGDHDAEERLGHLASPLGKQQRPITECVAGDLATIARLAHAETGDTLADRDHPAVIEAWPQPEPLLPVAVVAKSKADEDKLGQALARLVAEDPTLRLERNAETHQLVLWCIGEAHADVLLDRLRSRYGVEVATTDLRVPLRETFAGRARGLGRHVKQSGGHGQYAVCQIEVEPSEPGSGFTFVDRIVGGAIPNQFIPSVEKGVRAQMERGVRAGYPVVDIQVTLVDGKAHPVDSSDMAFQLAGALALREAAAAGEVSLLEPILAVEVLVPDEFLGAILGDLAGRRGRVAGSEPVGTGRTLVRAEVPETELVRYAIDLRALTSGAGTFSRRYLRHDPMPAHLAAKVTPATGG